MHWRCSVGPTAAPAEAAPKLTASSLCTAAAQASWTPARRQTSLNGICLAPSVSHGYVAVDPFLSVDATTRTSRSKLLDLMYACAQKGGGLRLNHKQSNTSACAFRFLSVRLCPQRHTTTRLQDANSKQRLFELPPREVPFGVLVREHEREEVIECLRSGRWEVPHVLIDSDELWEAAAKAG